MNDTAVLAVPPVTLKFAYRVVPHHKGEIDCPLIVIVTPVNGSLPVKLKVTICHEAAYNGSV